MDKSKGGHNGSPFHAGERRVQSRLGVRDDIEKLGRRIIRNYMPTQHREFYQQLPFVLVGFADSNGNPWASILVNKPGFISSPSETQLHIDAQPIAGDPLANALKVGLKMGVLGIELHTRRRNRLTAEVQKISSDGFHLRVDQSFGNCPKYIQMRKTQEAGAERSTQIQKLLSLDNAAQTLISQADTFFVASSNNENSDERSSGADVSHRGGKAGFIRVDNERLLTIPDYYGNFLFNTLGNFSVNPRAGLLFIDFEQGHLLTLTGRVEIIWDAPDIDYFEGAERLWQFHIEHGFRIHNALPFRWELRAYESTTLKTGTWHEAAQKKQQTESTYQKWIPYRVSKIVDESILIKSVYLIPEKGMLTDFKSGQHISLKARINGRELIRSYSISSAPSDPELRISVKLELSLEKGVDTPSFSHFVHQQLRVGTPIFLAPPTGNFVFDHQTQRPAVMLAAGVGITPIISMARDALQAGLKKGKIRPVTILAAVKTLRHRAFFEELKLISQRSQGIIQTFWVSSDPGAWAMPGKDFQHKGRITTSLLQSVLPLDDYDFYVCGPAGFMQSMYDLLLTLGVTDTRIFTESFGPASPIRRAGSSLASFDRPASLASVKFTQSGFEQIWNPNQGSLLEFAETQGLTPEFGCRTGQCGLCRVRITEGRVCYQNQPAFSPENGEVLLCCAVPAANADNDKVNITLEL